MLHLPSGCPSLIISAPKARADRAPCESGRLGPTWEYQQRPGVQAAREWYVILAEPGQHQFPDLGIAREMQALQCLAAGLSMEPGCSACGSTYAPCGVRPAARQTECRTVAQLLGLAAAIGLVKPDLDGLFT